MGHHVIRVQTLWAWREGEDNPELLSAWDEFSIDDNHEGFREDFEKHRAAVGEKGVEFRELEVLLNIDEIKGSFGRGVLFGGVMA